MPGGVGARMAVEKDHHRPGATDAHPQPDAVADVDADADAGLGEAVEHAAHLVILASAGPGTRVSAGYDHSARRTVMTLPRVRRRSPRPRRRRRATAGAVRTAVTPAAAASPTYSPNADTVPRTLPRPSLGWHVGRTVNWAPVVHSMASASLVSLVGSHACRHGVHSLMKTTYLTPSTTYSARWWATSLGSPATASCSACSCGNPYERPGTADPLRPDVFGWCLHLQHRS